MNLCIFSGRITKDAETRYTQSGTPVSSFSIAVDCGFGEHKRTEFPRLVLWKRENLVKHLTKGKAISITCEMQERSWEDQDGQKRRQVEYVVKDLEFQQGAPRGSQSVQVDQMDDTPF
jgi:single-strand DNA-binding protein